MPRAKKIPYVAMKPAEVDDEAWRAVIEAWTNGLSDREAAFRASRYGDVHLTEADIKTWIKDNKDIAELKEYLHADLISEAKLTIADAIKNKDLKTVKWYLERKAANEFSTKAAVSFEGAVVELTLADKEKALDELMEKFDNE